MTVSAPLPNEMLQAHIETRIQRNERTVAGIFERLNELGAITHEALNRLHLEVEGIRAALYLTAEERAALKAEEQARAMTKREAKARGGRARAALAMREPNGQFISNEGAERAIQEELAAEYEAHAVGGRARALHALRNELGQFASIESRGQ
jgi:hypothetical protein